MFIICLCCCCYCYYILPSETWKQILLPQIIIRLEIFHEVSTINKENGLSRKKYLRWEITWKIILWYAENLYTTIIFCNIQKAFVVIKHFTTKDDQFIRKKQKPWLFISYINILTWHFKNKCFGYHIMNCFACFLFLPPGTEIQKIIADVFNI